MSTYHIDDHFSETLTLLLGKVLKDVTVFPLQELETNSEVMILQNRLIVVHEGQLGVCGRERNVFIRSMKPS